MADWDIPGIPMDRVDLRGMPCRVPKIFRSRVASRTSMTKLSNKKMKWIVDEVVKKGEDTLVVATTQGVTQRRVQQLVAYFKRHGEYPTLNENRRPKTHLTEEEKDMKIRYFYFVYEQMLQLLWAIHYKDELTFTGFVIELHEMSNQRVAKNERKLKRARA